MASKQTLEELIEERRRLAAESERIDKRLAALNAEIDSHFNRGQQQQQPQSRQPLPPKGA